MAMYCCYDDDNICFVLMLGGNPMYQQIGAAEQDGVIVVES